MTFYINIIIHIGESIKFKVQSAVNSQKWHFESATISLAVLSYELMCV